MTPRRSPTRAPPRTAFVILEYCGGERTDALHRKVSTWNPRDRIYVLDNASPHNRAACVTHRNDVNSYIGGGIRDCLSLAETLGAAYLFYCVNDVEFQDPVRIDEFQTFMDKDPEAVIVSCSLSADSYQAARFPWLVRREGRGVRRVRFADLVCCLIRLDFVRGFGGFPPSRGGWGYAREAAFHAGEQGRKILVNDACAVRHRNAKIHIVTPAGERIHKGQEADEVYLRRYENLDRFRRVLDPPDYDETLNIRA